MPMNRMNTLTATGIVLSSMPIGEYDKRIVLLTKELGKITAFARGARRMNSPYMAGTRPFSFGEFTLFPGRDSYSLNGIKIENYFDELSADFDLTCLGMYFMELASYFSRENLDGSETIKLIYATFLALLNKNIPNDLVRAIYELKMLVINGEYPEVFNCVSCGKNDNLLYFDKSANGVKCASCANEHASGLKKIEGSSLYAMQFIISSEIGKLYTFNLSESVLDEVKRIIGDYLKSKVDAKFKSLDMLKDNFKI